MAVTPIEARGRRCNSELHLFELTEDRSGSCPRCRWTLTPDRTALLLDEGARANIALRQLIIALRRLREPPGHLELRPHSVLRNLLEELGGDDASLRSLTSRDEPARIDALVRSCDQLGSSEPTKATSPPGLRARRWSKFRGNPQMAAT